MVNFRFSFHWCFCFCWVFGRFSLFSVFLRASLLEWWLLLQHTSVKWPQHERVDCVGEVLIVLHLHVLQTIIHYMLLCSILLLVSVNCNLDFFLFVFQTLFFCFSLLTPRGIFSCSSCSALRFFCVWQQSINISFLFWILFWVMTFRGINFINPNGILILKRPEMNIKEA